MSDHNLEQELKILAAASTGHESGIASEPSIKIVRSELNESASSVTLLPAIASQQAETISETAQATEQITVGNFVLEKEIGAGALGKVYQAHNVHTKAPFALKLISKEYNRNEASCGHLLEGLKNAAGASNPHLSAYYDCSSYDGTVYLVTDYLSGKTLKEHIAFGAHFESERFIDLMHQICQALKSLHQQNIVHGNLKPSNIFLQNSDTEHDFAKLVDFGMLGKFTEEQRDEYLRHSQDKNSFVNYMSPEQCLGYEIDERSDIYSLGLIMYEMLTGTPLVNGQSKMHTTMKQLNLRPRPIREICKDVPVELERIIMKCLEKNRSARYFSIVDLELDLDLAAASIRGMVSSHVAGSNNNANQKPASGNYNLAGNGNASEKDAREQRIKNALSAVIWVGVFSCIGIWFAQAIHSKLPHQRDFETMQNPESAIQSLQPPALAQAPQAPPRHHGRNHIPSFVLQREAEGIVEQALNPSTDRTIRYQINYYGAAPTQTIFSDSQYLLLEAAQKYTQAIDAIQREHRRRPFNEGDTQRLAGMQTALGEILIGARFADEGGRNDPTTFNAYEELPNKEMRFPPAFPGLADSAIYPANFDNAKRALDEAKRALGNKFGIEQSNLLWDSAFTEFKLGNIATSIDVHKQLLDIYNKQPLVDKEAIAMVHSNLGRLYLWLGENDKAVPEFKDAIKIDSATNKLGGSHTDQLSLDLARGLFRQGKYNDTVRFAKNTLKLMDERADFDPEYKGKLIQILCDSLDQVGKQAESALLERSARREGLL